MYVCMHYMLSKICLWTPKAPVGPCTIRLPQVLGEVGQHAPVACSLNFSPLLSIWDGEYDEVLMLQADQVSTANSTLVRDAYKVPCTCPFRHACETQFPHGCSEKY